MVTTLQELLVHGQSPWIDNITRGMLSGGELQRLIDVGIVGLTSNPTIFQKAIGSGSDYDAALSTLVRDGKSVSEIFENLVLADIAEAARILRPVYDRTEGRDGFVSIEVSPSLAFDTAGTVADARRFFHGLQAPNIMIKVPGTAEGIPAFRTLIGEGINVNVTLLFAVENYRHVAEAYVEGLETLDRSGAPIDRVASVASFFVSRVDTAVDEALNKKVASDPDHAADYRALLGSAAIANAKVAYADVYKTIFDGPRWAALAAKGARPQRALWASTSTKNPAYRDVIYVEELIGANTVNTMPPSTIKDFLDHGRVRDSLEEDVAAARKVLERLAAAGIDMEQVTDKLQRDGVASFAKSFQDLLDTIAGRRQEMLAHA
jgi:transaldolase/glucose-6-phosphate isomerase